MLLRKSLKLWALSLENHRRLKKEADHARYYFHARRSLMRWHAKSREARKRKREELLNNHLKAKQLGLMAKCISSWLQRARTFLSLQSLAEDVQYEKDNLLLEDILLHWRERNSSVSQSIAVADDHHKAHMLR
jgi:hypothetical protein